MTTPRRAIDNVRASRDGHEYHEAWTARRALQLLWPDSGLTAIAVEGLSPTDQVLASTATVEVADIAMYFHGNPNFEDAAKTTIAQFKYSITDKDADFRASKAARTIAKFGKTYRKYQRKYGTRSVDEKLDFQLITNQPISKHLLEAIDVLASGSPCQGAVKEQTRQFAEASGLTGGPLAEFAGKCKIIGRTDSLPTIKNELRSLLVDWSATSDSIARARLGNITTLVRDKAGYAGTYDNLITQADILAALEIAEPQDLLPCESRLPNIGVVVDRERLDDIRDRVSQQQAPLLVHAPGGVGKTVFMDTIANELANNHEVVFFDCFAGGAYRSPEDARHLPKKGLIHIANTLAVRSLCDPMLPDNPDAQGLIRTFRRRMSQCLDTLARVAPERKLVLLLDAIDNAAIAARQQNDDCFPVMLLESLHTNPIEGVFLIVSCRSERIPNTYATYDRFELLPFTKNETESFLRSRVKKLSATEINVAQARSGGNPRVLEYLVRAGRGLLDASEIKTVLELDELIGIRIDKALAVALERGYDQKTINAFLAGLAVLPPPVPIDEYAGAHDVSLDAVESFASDMTPLLERIAQGLMFRDEPTETFIRNRYASSAESLHRVATNLLKRQDISVYAARALPNLLHQLDDTERLFELAFDVRIPSSITTTFGKRNIQYARLRAATLHAASTKDHNKLVRLLVELATVAAVDQRGTDYVLGHPELVVASADIEAKRRMLEIRTAWQGSRHARLAIANALAGEPEESSRHTHMAAEWIEHYRRRQDETGASSVGPDHVDIAAIPFVLATEGRVEAASHYLTRWRNWYAYELCELVFGYVELAQSIGNTSRHRMGRVVNSITGIGPLAAALSFPRLSRATRKAVAIDLAACCTGNPELYLPRGYHRGPQPDLRDGLCKSAAVALSLGLPNEAMAILSRLPQRRPSLWDFQHASHSRRVFHHLFCSALHVATTKDTIHETDLLPRELVSICSDIKRNVKGQSFQDQVTDRIQDCLESGGDDDGDDVVSESLTHREKEGAARFLEYFLAPLMALTGALADVLRSNSRTLDKTFRKLIRTWEAYTKDGNSETKYFFRHLGFEITFFALWSRTGVQKAAVSRFVTVANRSGVNRIDLVRLVAILSQRPTLRELAGQLAVTVCTHIEREDEVELRASLFGNLARAILPASIDEASTYFRNGLDQMDAIGSGDHEFVNGLMSFGSQMKGDELDTRDLHTLTNVCELSMGEPERCNWGPALSKVGGLRGLAKLSRWDDRSKITLSQTLMPYLTGLVEHGKIDARDALSLNRLAKPVESYFSGTQEFARAIRIQAGPDPVVITELITQFQDNNPNLASTKTVDTLATLAKEALGPSELSKHMSTLCARYAEVIDIQNQRTNYNGYKGSRIGKKREDRNSINWETLEKIANTSNPSDEEDLAKTIDRFNAVEGTYNYVDRFFEQLRNRVSYEGRVKYIRHVAQLNNLFFHWKLSELEDAKEAWSPSSAALAEVYADIASPLIATHVQDLVVYSTLDTSRIKKISDVTGIPIPDLVVEVIKIIAREDSRVSGSVWLALATHICPQADAGHGQLALSRLLSSDAAKLADSVVDGPWTQDLYPSVKLVDLASGIIWRVLGSPYAIDRWRAAHCLRSFAKFGRWEIIDNVVARIGSVDAGPFQAKELPFYYLHARLWLLIALARIAKDFPAQISEYRDDLLPFVLEDKQRHVLMCHFASRILRACIDAGKLTLPPGVFTRLCDVNRSPYNRLNKRLRRNGGFYSSRPNSVPRPRSRIYLEYDFHKYDVDGLSRIFGQPCWKVADIVSGIVRRIDPEVESMSEDGGRESRYRRTSWGMTTRYHTHGQQLCWHALLLAAGRLLQDYPVTDDDSLFNDDPWRTWLNRRMLTRDDDLWLSDGTDRTPLDTATFLLERKGDDLAITGDRQRILSLVLLNGGVGKEIVVHGHWFSTDNVGVHVSSALVSPEKGAALARRLVDEQPMFVWLPCLDKSEDDSECVRGDMRDYKPWVVWHGGSARLDEHDPYGVSLANCRPYLAHEIASAFSLSKIDEFGRVWNDTRGRSMLSAETWGRDHNQREDGPHAGTRLICTSSLLKGILMKYDKELLVLIKLQRYEKRSQRIRSGFIHTVAVARITKTCVLEYFGGQINHTHV